MIKNLNLYTSFIAVAKAGSVTAAARSLFITQPSLSADIKKLEAELGVPLFFRTPRGMALTDEGRLCLEYAERAFAFLEAGEDGLSDIAGLRAGRLRIGASDMTLRFFLLDHLGKFRREYPDVSLSVTNAPTPRTLSALRDGLIDFGVITTSGGAYEHGGEDDLVVVPVREIRDIFVCSPDFPLAGEKNVSYARLSEFPLIMLEGETSTTAYVRRAVNEAYPDVRLEASIEPATSDLVLEFALRGMGVAAIVEDFAEKALADGRAVAIDVPPLPPREMAVAYLKNPPLCAAAKRLLAGII